MKNRNHPDIWWTERPQRRDLFVRASAGVNVGTDSVGNKVWITTFFIVALVPSVGLGLKIAAGWGA